ncbi:hypothetical protein RIF29_14200 [Crotalaria pallida]|uniref:RSE1/DDB1/CPSF1 first beta-propeller domain-containing protein n=1 Tax=Crotalaria pallida TaxID=3830 RepID=A0AAN9FB11_CROPI
MEGGREETTVLRTTADGGGKVAAATVDGPPFSNLSSLLAMLDVPIYGRIGTLELFRPYGEARDYLFIATERYKFCVLQCDPETSELVTRLALLILIVG